MLLEISILWMNTAEYEKKSEITPKRVNNEDYHEDNVLMIGN